MSAQVRRGRTTDPEWKRRLRALPVPLAILVVLALLIGGTVYACSGPDDPGPSGGVGDGKVTGPSFSVSYAGGASRLRGLDRRERTEQIRDWARFGLASWLGMSTEGYRAASYDTPPVRDRSFDGLARQASGPGRFLHDGSGRRDTLHVLVPGDDEHRKRTVARQIDQYRADAGSDPKRVQVHEYEIRSGGESVRISAGKAAKTTKVRAAYGYVTKRVDTADGLRGFLKQTDRLSSLERRGSKVYAHGWSSGSGKQLVDAEDVSVLQRGYAGGSPPGFSLDPSDARDPADVRAALPGLSRGLADDVAKGTPPPGSTRQVDDALFGGRKHAGLPDSRAQLFALYRMLRGGGPTFTQARYDGGLAGTEVGMTLFYTDYVAKHWVAGAGSGNGALSKKTGFVADPDADIPWGQCTGRTENESGRLWFGQNQSGFSYGRNRVDVGEQATRLFARADGADGGEVEPSYAFGRGLRWWDRHYQDVAGFEPQYERLEELMRWAGALDWLSEEGGGAELPRIGDEDITSGLRFEDWYAEHDELRERRDIEFVEPPSAEHEALQPGVSKVHDKCGRPIVQGGVSLAGRVALGGVPKRPDLPHGLQRAGEFESGAAFDGSAGTGNAKQVWKDDTGRITDSVERTFSRGDDGGLVVTAKSEGRSNDLVGELPQTQAEKSSGELRSEFSGAPGSLRHDVRMSGQKAGTAQAVRTGNLDVTVRFDRGLRDRFQAAVRSMQEKLAKGGKPVPGSDDVLYEYRDGGTSAYKADGDAWIVHTEGDKADGALLAARLGAPGGPGGGARSSTAALVPGGGGKGPGAPRGPPGGGYIEAKPPGEGSGRPAVVQPAAKPGEEAKPGTDSEVTVETFGGESSASRTTGEIVDVDGRPRAKADDPVVGLGGTPEGAALMAHYPEVRSAMKDAGRAGDGTYRAVELGPGGADGIALARPGEVVLVESGTQWAAKVQHALAADRSAQGPVIRYRTGGEPQYVSKDTFRSDAGEARTYTLGELLPQHSDVFASSRLHAQLSGRKGEFPRYAPKYRNLTVVAVPVEKAGRVPASVEGRNAAPDAYRYDGEHWVRIVRPGEGTAPAKGVAGGGPPVRIPGPNTTPYIACTEEETDDPDSPCHREN